MISEGYNYLMFTTKKTIDNDGLNVEVLNALGDSVYSTKLTPSDDELHQYVIDLSGYEGTVNISLGFDVEEMKLY